MYMASLTAVSGFPPRLPNININTCRRDGRPCGGVWSDKERPRRRRQRPFLSHNCPSSRPTDDTPVHFLSIVLRPYGTEYPVKPYSCCHVELRYSGTRVFCSNYIIIIMYGYVLMCRLLLPELGTYNMCM